MAKNDHVLYIFTFCAFVNFDFFAFLCILCFTHFDQIGVFWLIGLRPYCNIEGEREYSVVVLPSFDLHLAVFFFSFI